MAANISIVFSFSFIFYLNNSYWCSSFIIKKKNACKWHTVVLTALQQCNITYRPPLKVIIQRFVQQCSLTASLRAHQCNVDIVIRPCKPLAPRGNSHCVRWHGGHTRWKWLQKPSKDKEICRKSKCKSCSVSCNQFPHFPCTTPKKYETWQDRELQDTDKLFPLSNMSNLHPHTLNEVTI